MPHRIEKSAAFNKSVKNAKKEYYRKSDRDYARFLEAIQGFLTCVHDYGARCQGAFSEKWPDGTYIEGWRFDKYYFKVPGHKGAAQQGRIPFLTNDAIQVVYPLFFYTHREYPDNTRPPEKLLAQMISQALQDVQETQRQMDAEEAQAQAELNPPDDP